MLPFPEVNYGWARETMAWCIMWLRMPGAYGHGEWSMLIFCSMNMIKRILDKLSRCLWGYCHERWQRKMRAGFRGKQPTILSCNCLGGIIYHDLGLQFTSPTINLYMSCPDFIRFLENLDHYLALPITPYEGHLQRDYPLGVLGDLTLFFVHYHSFDEACRKWQQRVQRVDRENIFVLATDRDGYTPGLLERFRTLPYRNKKLFTHMPVPHSDCVYIRGFEQDGQVGELMAPAKGGKRVIDQFDYVAWFNGDS